MGDNVVYMGNLKKDGKKKQLANCIHDVFRRCLGIPLNFNEIHIKSGRKGKYAFINLKSEEDVETTCDILGSWENRSRLNFNFLQLVDPSQPLIVNRKNTVNGQDGQYGRGIVEHWPMQSGVDMGTEEKDEGLKTDQMSRNTRNNEKQYYEEGELLGNETRRKEFKEGTGEHFVKKNLKEHVAKYMCGFLNSSEQGTLFIGVNDQGRVNGIKCDQEKEDEIRLKIDKTIKSIKPTIFPQNYRVEFVPVFTDGQVKADVKVIEITIDKIHPDKPSELYQALGEVYVRRDGSIQKLEPFEVQNWAKQVHQNELQINKKELESVKRKLEEAETEKSELQSVKKKLEEAEAEKNELQSVKKKLEQAEAEKNELQSVKTKLEQAEAENNELESVKKKLEQAEVEKNTLLSEKKNHNDEKEKEIQNLQKQIRELKNAKHNKSKVCVIL